MGWGRHLILEPGQPTCLRYKQHIHWHLTQIFVTFFFFFNLHAQFFCLSHQCMSLTKYGTICKGNNQAPLFAPVWNLKWNLTYTFYPATCVLFTQLCFALSAFIVCTGYNNTTREVATHPFSWTSKIIDIYTHSRRWCPIFFFPYLHSRTPGWQNTVSQDILCNFFFPAHLRPKLRQEAIFIIASSFIWCLSLCLLSTE